MLLVMLLGVAVLVLLSRDRARGIEPGRADGVTGDVVSGLMTELRKSQAESAHWKATAERLQRELDQRSPPR